jgi:hypothetical protein
MAITWLQNGEIMSVLVLRLRNYEIDLDYIVDERRREGRLLLHVVDGI